MSRRTPTRRDLVLRLLREASHRGVTTNELLVAGAGARYSARVLELRERGYEISSERLRDGQWRYTLLRSPEPPSMPPAAPAAPPRLFDGES